MSPADQSPDDVLLTRLRRALGARYDVERLVGAGGMGRVYVARDRALDRRVAIKVVPPELATAVAVERFHREAKTLADLTHPNIVPVYDVGEAEGLLYYLMQYVEGETLASRLARGPLPPDHARAVALQLLEALGAAHRRGVVHRDIKPGNVMLVGERVVLTDFGIAKRPVAPGETLTEAGAIPGTPGYFAPEATWGEVTARSDLYSAAMVIYEAHTGRHWEGLGRPEDADWSGVPARTRDVLARALALAPAERWPDADSFKQALERGGAGWPPRARAAAWSAALTALALAAWLVIPTIWPHARGSQLVLAIPRLAYTAGPTGAEWVADSITAWVRRSLSGPDVEVRSSKRRGGDSEISGSVSVTNDTVRVALTAEAVPLPPVRPSPITSWRGAADSAALRIWHEVWRRFAERGPVPSKVIPRDPAAFERFVHGERLFALARWPDAAAAYARAEALDSTCLLCTWRLHDVARWLSYSPEGVRYHRLLANVDSFPPHYQAVIRAAVAPTVSRVDSLRAAVERAPDFWTAWFHLAEELFHRGPLVGHPRRDADLAYTRVTQINGTFAPAWHHLAWLRTAEGDRAGAEAALANLRRAADAEDAYSLAFGAFVGVSFAWRFLPDDSARALTAAIVADPRMTGFPDVGAGARFLVGFDAPHGAIAVAHLLEARDLTAEARRSAQLARVFGNVALGRPSAAREALGEVRATSDRPELALFAAQLDAALELFGPAGPSALAGLEEHLVPYPGAERRVRRAAYLAALLEGGGRPVTDSKYRRLLDSEPAPKPLATLVAADAAARRGDLRGALERSLALVGSLDSSETVADPFFRTAHHLKRAEWYRRLNSIELAQRELGWFENSDIASGYPTGDPRNVEVDWAFGAEARWRRARLLDGAGRRTATVCEGYRATVRLWSQGEPPYAARADSARARLEALGCPA